MRGDGRLDTPAARHRHHQVGERLSLCSLLSLLSDYSLLSPLSSLSFLSCVRQSNTIRTGSSASPP